MGKATIQCPRCLGKGHVDWDDIKRLKNESKWLPGKCAYCNGKGRVDPDKALKLPVDTVYLVHGLPMAERERLFKNDPDAMERARMYNRNVEVLIQEIRDLFYVKNLEPEDIADHFIRSVPNMDAGRHKKERAALIDYINAVVHPRR